MYAVDVGDGDEERRLKEFLKGVIPFCGTACATLSETTRRCSQAHMQDPSTLGYI